MTGWRDEGRPVSRPGRFPPRTRVAPAVASAGVLDGARLAYDRHLHLARVLHVLLDATGDVAREEDGAGVVDLVGLDDDADLAAGLDGVALLDAGEARGDRLERLEALEVDLERLAAGSRTGGADGVGGVDEHGEEGGRPVEVVMVGDGVDDLVRLAEAASEPGSDLGVRALHLAIDRLADVVHQARAPRHRLVEAQLRRDDARQVRHLDGVLEDVLAVAGAEVHPAEELQQPRLDPDHVRLERGFLAALADVGLHVLLGLVHDLLDPRGVDPSVLDQLVQRQPGDLAPQRVEAGQQHRLGGVVDDQVDAGQRLERTDVAALSADDAPLHRVARDRHDRHRDRGRHLAGAALDRLREDALAAALGVRVGALQGGADPNGLLALELALEPVQDDPLGLLAIEPGDLVQATLDLRLAVGQGVVAAAKLVLARVEALLLIVEAQGARVLLFATAGEAVLEHVELLALAAKVLPRAGDLLAVRRRLLQRPRDVARRFVTLSPQLGADRLALARQLGFGPLAVLARSLTGVLGGPLLQAGGLLLGLRQQRAGVTLGLGRTLLIAAAAQQQADRDAQRQADETEEPAHAAPSVLLGPVLEAWLGVVPAAPAPDEPLVPLAPSSSAGRFAGGRKRSVTSLRMAVNSSGRSARNSRAFSLPCPKRVSPYENHDPLFCTTSRSVAIPNRSPILSIPRPKMISTSASLNGGATLFFVTFTRVRFPTLSAPTFTSPLRRTSMRTLA